jgi:putative sigma-54 modulation protein
MQVNVTFRKVEPSEPIRRYADEKVQRVAKYAHNPIDAHVILAVSKRVQTAEIILNADHKTFAAKEDTGDLYSAIDMACDKLEHQLRKRAGKRTSMKHAPPPPRKRPADMVPPASEARGRGLRMDVIRADTFSRRNGPEIIKSTRLPVKPMSVEEAVMQMDLMSNEFLVFRNAATETLSVVYRRKDGNYGLIEPEPA